MRSADLGTVALFSICLLPTSSGKHLEDISHAHIVSLKYKPINGSKGSDNLSIGFDRDRIERQRDLDNNETQNGKYQIRV